MSFKLIVGIPSFNEADTISNVVRNIDDALSSLKSGIEAKIVNSDNGSTDLTVEKFMCTGTIHEKVSLKTTIGGKGANLKKIFEFALYDKADAVIFMDSDLSFVSELWIKELTEKLLLGYEAVFTRRIPIWNYGDLTYHVTYPLVLNFWNAQIHQPISGDFGFSISFIRNCLEHEWDKNILGYGVDFFLTSNATDFNWCEVILEGKKDHKLRSYNRDNEGFITMNPKFSEVMFTVKNLILKQEAAKKHEKKSVRANQIGEIKWIIEAPPHLDKDIEELKLSILKKYSFNKKSFKHLNSHIDKYFCCPNFYGIPNSLWIECLKRFIDSDYNDIQVDLYETVFLSRVVGFYYDILSNKNWYSIVENNAKEFSTIKL